MSRPSLLCHGLTPKADVLASGRSLMYDTYRSRNDQVLTPLAAYLRDIQQIPLLTVDKEKALTRRGCAGDVAARDHPVRAKVVSHTEYLVFRLAEVAVPARCSRPLWNGSTGCGCRVPRGEAGGDGHNGLPVVRSEERRVGK